MRMCGKQVKKSLVFVLLLTLLVSMVRPLNSYADELANGVDKGNTSGSVK